MQHTVRVTTDCDFMALLNVVLDHGGLLFDNVHDGDDDLVDVLLGQLLSVLKSFNHVLYELECHLVLELCAVV